MANVIAGIVTPNAVTLMVDGNAVAIDDAHVNYGQIRKLTSAGRYSEIGPLVDIASSINTFGQGAVTVENGEVMYMGKPTHNAVTDRIMAMMDEGLSVEPMLRFLENLMQNPSYRSVQQLYGFLEVNDLPITEDGYFLAYKMVRDNFTDHRTGTFDYSVGAPPARMPRNEVNEDPEQTCSYGLHVCAQGYLGFYSQGSRTILVKVNPRDVVAVPTDYKNAKMRVCEHVTVQEIDPDTRGNVFTSSVYKPVDTVLASADNVMTVEEAMMHFYGDTDSNARSALRKRLNRGVTAKRVYADNLEMVQIIDTPVADEGDLGDLDDAEHNEFLDRVYNGMVTPEEAMEILDIDKDALRKRLNRGATVARDVSDTGEEMVRILILTSDDEDRIDSILND